MKKPSKVIVLNQDLVREKLRQKKFDEVCLSSWGQLDELIQFITSFGLFTMLAQLGLTTGHSGIPFYLLAMLAFVKPLFGIRLNDNVKYLFQDYHVLRLHGSKPIRSITLTNFLSSLGYKETTGLMVQVVRTLFKLGFSRRHHFCIDTKVIFKDSSSYEFAKKVYDYKGKHKNRRGYKVSIIQHVKSNITVSVIMTSANVADKRLLLTTVRQAVTILGPGVIKTFIFDKGYWDGNSLTKLKK
jgi:hypothetical protein